MAVLPVACTESVLENASSQIYLGIERSIPPFASACIPRGKIFWLRRTVHTLLCKVVGAEFRDTACRRASRRVIVVSSSTPIGLAVVWMPRSVLVSDIDYPHSIASDPLEH